ncbi:hypothetical protein [Kangiella sp. TOML190]|uniref:tetratricopeptide repeat protein n=1 Tax=Kangiella sp. TOML190 TaxID=2931351 RepID=UPI00203A8213|nr:hypothetical protein [Kangiella sp. TOML190]
MVMALLILVALAWAAWLFSGVFKGTSKKLLYMGFACCSVLVSYGVYHQLGANQKISNLTELHQSLAKDDLRELLEKTTQQKISIEDLFAEMRLRSMQADSQSQWMTFGRLLLQSEQVELAEQAFNRATHYGDSQIQNQTKLEVAQIYLEKQLYPKAQTKVDLVLLNNPKHEGALLLKGLVGLKQQDYQSAIDAWSFLLSRRHPNSDSAKLLQQQIDKARQQLAEAAKNFVQLEIVNFTNLPLHSFTKAFALVRPLAGGAPIAVKSVDIDDLEQSITITPDNLMLAGANFWQVTDLYIEIRLSQSGFAKPESGDLYGRTATLQGLTPSKSYQIVIDKTVN